MTGEGLTKRDLDQIFTGFEKRQDEKLKGLEERMDSKLKGLGEQMDSKLTGLEARVVNQFHIISEGLVDQIKLLAEGHVGIVHRLDRIEKENEHQHMETRALIKLSFAELEWRTKVESRLQS